MSISLHYYFILSLVLFSLGLAIVIIRKHIVLVLCGIELMLNAANINFVAFAKQDDLHQGYFVTLFVMLIAVCEATVGLAILINVYKYFKVSELDKIKELK